MGSFHVMWGTRTMRMWPTLTTITTLNSELTSAHRISFNYYWTKYGGTSKFAHPNTLSVNIASSTSQLCNIPTFLVNIEIWNWKWPGDKARVTVQSGLNFFLLPCAGMASDHMTNSAWSSIELQLQLTLTVQVHLHCTSTSALCRC